MKLNENNLKKLILEVLEESEYYNKHKDMDTDHATQAMELGQSMSDEGSRDRTEQVEKYVQLKVNKEIKKDLIAQVQWAIDNLVLEAAGVIGIKGDEINSSFYEDDMQHFRNMYSKKLTRSMELAQAFDGTQESVDAWTQEMINVDQALYNSKDMGIHYLGSIVPSVLHIGDAFWQSYDDDPGDDWGGNYQKSVELENAIEQAGDFYRPGIMKMVLKAQGAETGMDLGDMFGLNENEEEELEPKEKEHLIQLLNGDEEMIRQGVALADMLVPDLVDKVDEMDSNSQLPMVFLEIFKSEVQKEVQKYSSGGMSSQWKRNEDIVNSIVADDSALWTTDRVPRKNDDYMGKTMIQVLSELQFDLRFWAGDHLIVAALDILDERIEHVAPFLATHFYSRAGYDIINVLKAAFKDRSKLEPYIEKWKASELVKLIK